MSRLDELILEVKSKLKKYDEAGLIDEISMRRDALKALKRFGNSIGTMTEGTVEIVDGIGYLPDNFISLYMAILCEPHAYTYTGEIDALQTSYFYKERVIESSTWNECESCCQSKTENVIRENLYFNGGSAQFVYKNPTLLKLGRSFEKSKMHLRCRNRVVKDNPNEISIIGSKIQANFNSGHIYLQYYGLPTDEDGQPDIPETFNGELETYLEYHLLRRCAEDLLANSDAMAGLASLYPVYKQEEVSARDNASNELKMLSPSSIYKVKALNRLESLQYQIIVPWH